ncbi:MAG: DMT family transporter [Myxococcota bacterium]
MAYALVFGFLLPMVVRMNEVLGRTIGQLPSSVGVHVIGGIFGACLILPFQGRAWIDALPKVPWWAFLGGVIGTGLVVLANRAVGALGVASFTAVNIAAQLVTSGVMDHFGLFGSESFPMSLPRIAGMALLCVGAVLVVRG